MPRDITMQVIATERARSALRDAGDAHDQLATRAESANKRMSESSSVLSGRLREIRTEVDELTKRYAETGDSKYLRDINVRTRETSQITRILKDQITEIPAAMGGLTSQLPSTLGTAISALGPTGQAAAVTIGALLATSLTTGLAGGMLGGAGGLAIATGIAGAVRDPRVAEAATGLKETLLNQLGDIGKPFVGPLLKSIVTIKSEVGNLGLDRAFAPLAGTIGPITNGLMAMAREAMPGIRKMAEAAVPVVMQLVADMPELGKAVGDFAEALAAAGPGAAKLFHGIVVGVEMALTYFGTLIEYSGKFINLLGSALEKLGVYDFNDKKAKTKDFADSGVDAFGRFGSAADAANAQLMTLKQTIDAMSGATISAMEAESAFQAAIDAASESVNKNGTTLDLNTKAGRDNQSALLAIVKSAQDLAQATYDQTYAQQGETAAQNAGAAAWQRGRDQLFTFARSMNMSTAEAAALADKIMGIPNFKNVRVSVETSAAEAALARVRSQLASLPSVNTAELSSYYGQVMGAKAEGGPVRAGQMYLVGEKRPELFVPKSDGYIMPEVPRMGSGKPWGGGGTTINVSVQAGVVASASELASQIAALLRQYVGANGPMPELVGSTS